MKYFKLPFKLHITWSHCVIHFKSQYIILYMYYQRLIFVLNSWTKILISFANALPLYIIKLKKKKFSYKLSNITQKIKISTHSIRDKNFTQVFWFFFREFWQLHVLDEQKIHISRICSENSLKWLCINHNKAMFQNNKYYKIILILKYFVYVCVWCVCLYVWMNVSVYLQRPEADVRQSGAGVTAGFEQLDAYGRHWTLKC